MSKSGCSNSYEEVAIAAQMYHKEQIQAFIGPYCNSGFIKTLSYKLIF